jgi:hypothetical protein
MCRNDGYMKCAADKAVRLRKYSSSDRHCDVMQCGTVSPCFAFHLIQPRRGVGEREREREKEG